MERAMPVNLSIKNVPDEIAERLRKMAKESHRSLQGELLHILERAVREQKPVDLGMVRERIAHYGVKTGDESSAMIREDRDAR
jgi:plasmid stability protein